MLFFADATSKSLIGTDATWLLWTICFGGVALCIYLEQNFKWASRIGGPVLVLCVSMLLSTFGILPKESIVFGDSFGDGSVIGTYFVPIAIPLLLFRASIFHIIKTTGKMFFAFHLCVVGTIIGAILASLFLHAWYAGDKAQEQVPKLAGIMAASYSGGSVNFYAVNESFTGTEAVDSSLTSTLLIADNIIMAAFFLMLLVMAGMRLFLNAYPHPHSEEESQVDGELLAAKHWRRKEIALIDIAKALAIAVGIATLANYGSQWIIPQETPVEEQAEVADKTAGAKSDNDSKQNKTPSEPKETEEEAKRKPSLSIRKIVGNKYVLITAISLLLATLFRKSMSNINGAEEFGSYLLYTFFFKIGVTADLRTIFSNAAVLFIFCLIIAVVNLIVTLGLGKLFKMNLEDLLICVNATLGGPPSAAAMAIAKGWEPLILPALLVGIWGYVIGTFIGLMTTEIIQLIL